MELCFLSESDDMSVNQNLPVEEILAASALADLEGKKFVSLWKQETEPPLAEFLVAIRVSDDKCTVPTKS